MNVLHRNKSWLYQKYREEKLSLRQIAKICGCCTATIRYQMKKFKILRRNLSESLKGRKFSSSWKQKISENHADVSGKKNPMWGKRGKDNPNWGIYRSIETRKRLSISKLGKNNPMKNPEVSKKVAEANIGKHPTEKTREKMSEARKKRIGEKSPAWRGGISFEPYGSEFNRELKSRIRARDNNQCQIPECGIYENGKCHAVHHIDYDKKNNEDWNLITLCHSCHNKTNGNREHWQKYFKGEI